MSRRILVTGVAGFIGSNLARTLLERGDTVVGLDNMSWGQRLNLVELEAYPRFIMRYADVCEFESVVRIAEGCDAIAHLAAYKIPRYSDAVETLTANARGAESVARAAVEHRAKLVAASTSDVYGKNPALPFSESSDLVVGGPEVRRWSYAISKMFEEQLLFAYHERHGIDVVLIRFFGGYGPNQHPSWWGGPQAVFINSALDDTESEIHGDGQQTRSFTFVSDHVAGIIAAIESAAVNNMVLNLGSTEEITIERLARLVWRLTRGEETTPRLKLLPYAALGKYEDVRRRVPDVTRAETLVGFRAKVPLEAGLRETIRWQVARRRQLGIETRDPRC